MGSNRSDITSISKGSAFVDRSVPSLSTAQAAGTAPVLAANPSRSALTFYPVTDGFVSISSSADDGMKWPLYGGVSRTFAGGECPTGAIYVTGQASGTKLRMAEA